MKKTFNNKGFSLIELLIAGLIVTIAFTAVSTFLLFSRDATLKTQRRAEAVSFAEEAIEVVRKLRDDSWSANIAPLVSGATYYPVVSAGEWTLSTVNHDPNSFYTTTIVLSDVNRDANDNISSSGTFDENTKKVVASVSWNDGGPKKIEITTYITNFSNN